VNSDGKIDFEEFKSMIETIDKSGKLKPSKIFKTYAVENAITYAVFEKMCLNNELLAVKIYKKLVKL
jgi:hypothetical protein